MPHYQRARRMSGQRREDTHAESDRLVQLGHAAEERGDPGAALAHYRAAVAAAAHYPRALVNLANGLLALGHTDEASSALRECIAFDPQYAPARYNLGRIHAGRRELDAAESEYRAALAADPMLSAARISLADVLEAAGREKEAEDELRVSVSAGDPGAACNLGMLLSKQQRYDEAEEAFTRAAAAEPGLASAWAGLGSVLVKTGRARDADNAYRQAIASDRSSLAAYSGWLFSLNFRDDVDADAVFAAHRGFDASFARTPAPPLTRRPGPELPIRIAYVSGELCRHPVGLFLRPVLALHDRTRFEVHVYSSNPRDDDLTAVLRHACEHWHDVADLDDASLADRIRADGIDLLVDLAGHTGVSRPGVFLRRAAPAQCTWLGYLNTTGLRSMDYRLCDASTDPPGLTERFHSERLIRLPDSQWCYAPFVERPLPSREGRNAGRPVVLGAFNQFAKISDTCLDLWCEIMRARPLLRLRVFDVPEGRTRAAFQERLASRGIAAGRVELIGRLPIDAYFAALGEIDLALDTFPYNGATTTLDTLWMGVPVIGMAGPTSHARGTASLLRNLGRPEWIAASPAHYVELNLRLVDDSSARQTAAQSLRAQLTDSPLMDAPRFVRNLEFAFSQMIDAAAARGAAEASS